MEFPMDRPTIQIGRGSGNDIMLQDSQASRQHTEISQRGDQYYIRDLGSTNGTFVNNERITGTRLLQPGDQIRIGETTLSCQIGAMAAVPGAGRDWESQLWEDTTGAQPAGSKRKPLIWALVGLAAVLLVAGAVAAVLLLGGGGKGTPTALVVIATEAPTQAIVVAPTPTTESGVQAAPSVTPIVELPTTELLPTVEVKVTATVKPPQPPKQPTGLPSGLPSSPQQLEQLPAAVQQYLGNVPPEQLPDLLAAQIQSLAPEQVQGMIAALFPGVSPDKLPQVVAASFPGLKAADVQGLLSLAFPGQSFQLPQAGAVGGRLVMGIYDKAKGQHNLYAANAMGGQLTLLTELGSDPDFSPDGQWVVYFSWDPAHLGLRLIKADGSSGTQLTSVQEHGYPTFSPDGGRISFYHNVNKILHVINRDGTGMRDIGQGEYPAWSPIGDQIVYRGCVGGGKCGLIVANADGSNPRQITTHANDAAPRWSPNGGQITFHSDRDGNWEIYVINVDGSWLRRITTNPTTDIMPVWSSDGLRIAFRSDRGGKGAIWATSGVGGPATKLFDAEFDPQWPELAQMDWVK
jgi:TolB protein